MNTAKAFTRLLKQQPSAEHRERLHRIRDELGLADNDALWNFVALIEQHTAETRRIAQPTPAHAPHLRWVCFGLALQTLFGAVCLRIGAQLEASPPSLLVAHRDGTRGLVLSALSAPAGWLTFVFALPGCLSCARTGWRLVKAGEGVWGWAVVCSSCGCLAASAFALWRLL